jgi:hypothetical protein
MLEGGSWKGCENVTNKDLVVYSYEQRRMEATFKGGQDTCRIIEVMMMMMIFVFVVTLNPHAAATTKYARTFILFI